MKIKVTKNSVILESYIFNQGEYNVNFCEFEFTNDYNGLVKKAVFDNGTNKIEMAIVGDICSVPYEVLQDKEFKLRVYAYEVIDDKLRLRYSPTPTNVYLRPGSYEGESGEEITPSQFEQYSQALENGLAELNNKLIDIDENIAEVQEAIDNIHEATKEVENLDLDVSDKVDGKVNVKLTRKDATTKTVTVEDGISLQFKWDGTSLGIKTEDEQDFHYVNLQGVQGEVGPQGEAFKIKKTYPSVQAMQDDFNNMEFGDYVMITSTVEEEDNAKLYNRGEEEWIFISDFSGAIGIQGPIGNTPNIQIGTVTSGATPSVTRSGSNEEPILNFVLQKGDKGDTGSKGDTGNGIASIERTGRDGLVDTYTITYTNGNKTTFEITNGEDGEVTQKQLNEVREEASRYQNAVTTETTEEYPIEVNNAVECNADNLTIYGNSNQETTTGNNIFKNSNNIWNDTNVGIVNYDISNDTFIFHRDSGGDYIISSGRLELEANTTYTLYFNVLENSMTDNFISVRTTSNLADLAGKLSIPASSIGIYTSKLTTGDLSEKYDLWLYCNSKGTLKAKIMLLKGEYTIDTMPKYEPYTGGQPSPSPDYPSEVKSVESGFENLLDIGEEFTVTSGEALKRFYVDLKGNTNYTIKFGDITTNNNNLSRILFQFVGNNDKYLGDKYAYLTEKKTTFYYDEEIKRINIFSASNYNESQTTTTTFKDMILYEGLEDRHYVPYGKKYLPISVIGKNLLNYRNIVNPISSNQIIVDKNDNIYSSTPESDNRTWAYTNSNYFLKLKEGNYKLLMWFSKKVTKENAWTYIYTKSKAIKVNSIYNQDKVVMDFTLNEETDIGIMLKIFDGICKIMLIDNDKQTSEENWMPYKGQDYYYPLEHELCKIGDVADELDIVNGKLIKRIGKIVLDGSDGTAEWNSWNQSILEQYQLIRFTRQNWLDINANVNIYKATISNCFRNDITNNYTLNSIYKYNKGLAIILDIHDFPDVETFKNWLKEKYDNGTPVIVYYVLAEPQEIVLDPFDIKLLKDYNQITINDKYNLLDKAKLGYYVDNFVSKIGDETIYGVKTFNKLPECSEEPTKDEQLVNKAYVDKMIQEALSRMVTPTKNSF